MGRKVRFYELNDGSIVTVDSVMAATGICRRTVADRLCKTNDRAKIFKKVQDNGRTGKYKIHTLDDGSEWTTLQLCEKSGIKYDTMMARINRKLKSKEPLTKDFLFSQVKLDLRTSEKDHFEKLYNERMEVDSDGFWSLFNKNV